MRYGILLTLSTIDGATSNVEGRIRRRVNGGQFIRGVGSGVLTICGSSDAKARQSEQNEHARSSCGLPWQGIGAFLPPGFGWPAQNGRFNVLLVGERSPNILASIR